MKLSKSLAIVSVVVLVSPVGFVHAKVYCPGETAILNYSISNVVTGGSCDSQITPPFLSPYPSLPSGGITVSQGTAQGSVSYTVSEGGTFSFSCTNPGASPTTGSTVLEVNANQERCCGNWDLSSKSSWNGTTCVDPFSVVPQAPAWIGGSCRRI